MGHIGSVEMWCTFLSLFGPGVDDLLEGISGTTLEDSADLLELCSGTYSCDLLEWCAGLYSAEFLALGSRSSGIFLEAALVVCLACDGPGSWE